MEKTERNGRVGAERPLTFIMKKENPADSGRLALASIAKGAVICADVSDAYDPRPATRNKRLPTQGLSGTHGNRQTTNEAQGNAGASPMYAAYSNTSLMNWGWFRCWTLSNASGAGLMNRRMRNRMFWGVRGRWG